MTKRIATAPRHSTKRLPVPRKIKCLVFLSPSDEALLTEICTISGIQRGALLGPVLRREAIQLGLRSLADFTGAKV